MGSTCGIWRDPSRWDIKKIGNLKNDGRELLEVNVGWYDDYQPGDFIVYMLKEHYDGILAGKINFKAHAYRDICFELFDSAGSKIEPLMRGSNYIY